MIFLKFGNQIKSVSKIKAEDFTHLHSKILSDIRFSDGNLVFTDSRWYSLLLGAGEEKAVFCICDHNNRVFALEIIDEKQYLNGRFIGGEYFFDMRIYGLINKKLNTECLIGLTFTGLVRVREYVHGYEWGRFQFDPLRKIWIDSIITFFLQIQLTMQFRVFYDRYKDVHERNVMFELRDIHERGILVLARNYEGTTRFYKVRLRAIDVR